MTDMKVAYIELLIDQLTELGFHQEEDFTVVGTDTVEPVEGGAWVRVDIFVADADFETEFVPDDVKIDDSTSF